MWVENSSETGPLASHDHKRPKKMRIELEGENVTNSSNDICYVLLVFVELLSVVYVVSRRLKQKNEKIVSIIHVFRYPSVNAVLGMKYCRLHKHSTA